MANFPNNDIIDIDLNITSKKKFRINGDDSKILELNTSDINVLVRLSEAIPKLDTLQDKVNHFADGYDLEKETGLTDNEMASVAESLRSVDNEMRDLIDFIFDSNVSEILAADGSMYDLFEGSYRFEYIIDKLMDLYDSNWKLEFEKVNNQVKKYTDKYTK